MTITTANGDSVLCKGHVLTNDSNHLADDEASDCFLGLPRISFGLSDGNRPGTLLHWEGVVRFPKYGLPTSPPSESQRSESSSSKNIKCWAVLLTTLLSL